MLHIRRQVTDGISSAIIAHMAAPTRSQPPGDPIFAFYRDVMLTGGDATRLYLIRHAQSQGNTGEGLTTGDPDLTDVGCEEAERLGERLKRKKLSAVHGSPLRRTQETAAGIGDRGEAQAGA